MTTIDQVEGLTLSRQPAKAKRDNNILLFLLVIGIPIQLMDFMNVVLFPIPASTLSHILVTAPFALLMIDKRLWRTTDRLERNALLFCAVYTVLFAAAFYRSVSYLDAHNSIFPEFAESSSQYVIYEFIIPMMYASTFVYVIKRMSTAEEMMQLFAAICVGILILSLVILVMAMLNPQYVVAASGGDDRAGMGYLCQEYLHMHYTAVGSMYVASCPILLYMALKRGSFWTLNFFIALAAVILVQARTALFIFAAASILTMVAMGRTKLILRYVPIVGGLLVVTLGSLIVKLLSRGGTAESGFNLSIFLSNRDTGIWLPLLLEWWNDPSKYYFGAGLHGMWSSNYLRLGVIYRVAEAHNAFIEMFLDYGIFMLAALIVAIAMWSVWAVRIGRRIRSRVFWVLLLCPISYLISCLTGRHFFPSIENELLFPIMGALINVVRLRTNAAPMRKEMVRKVKRHRGSMRRQIPVS